MLRVSRHFEPSMAVLILPALLGGPAVLRALEIDAVKAIKVKAAYLYNFTKFVTWPEDRFSDEDDPIVIGMIAGSEMFDAVGDAVDGKRVLGRGIVVRRLDLSKPADRERAGEFHLVFIDDAHRSQIPDVHRVFEGKAVFLVGESDNFAEEGGCLGFVVDSGRIVFEINRDAVERAGLKVSAKLLKLARIVS